MPGSHVTQRRGNDRRRWRRGPGHAAMRSTTLQVHWKLASTASRSPDHRPWLGVATMKEAAAAPKARQCRGGEKGKAGRGGGVSISFPAGTSQAAWIRRPLPSPLRERAAIRDRIYRPSPEIARKAFGIADLHMVRWAAGLRWNNGSLLQANEAGCGGSRTTPRRSIWPAVASPSLKRMLRNISGLQFSTHH